MKNYLTYPCKYMNISQNYSSIYSHSIHSTGAPNDFPIDEPCKDTGRDWLYCPCDEMKVMRIYGVNNGGTNTIWLTSTSKVIMPSGEDYITMLVMHPEDDDLSLIKTGQTFRRGEAICREGMDGNVTGNHFHISFGLGTIQGNGWQTNTKDAWVISTTGGSIKPEDACYIDPTFTTVMRTQGINFATLPDVSKESTISMIGIDVSKHNGAINWSSVGTSEAKFVIARAGFGSLTSQVDSRFHENITTALRYGLHVGAYWFSYALSIDDIKAEAALFAKTLEPYKGKMDFPVFFDLEYDSFNYAKKFGVTIDKSMATTFALTFCQEMWQYGWYCGNYTNLDCYLRYFDESRMKNIDTWLADWRKIDEPSAPCTIWQYSNTGSIKGITGNVDMNICYKDYPKFIQENGWNGYKATAPSKPETNPDNSTLDDLKVENDLLKFNISIYKSTLSGIEEKIKDMYTKLQ